MGTILSLLTGVIALGTAVFAWWNSDTRRRKNQVIEIRNVEKKAKEDRIHIRESQNEKQWKDTRDKLLVKIRHDK